MIVACTLFHRGFGLRILAHRAGDARPAYAYELSDGDFRLCVTEASYRSVASAERAGRRHVDDALGAYTWASERITEAA